MSYKIIEVTCKNKSEATKIAKVLVKEKLVACANVAPKLDSYYFWQGKFVSNQEALLILKTNAKKVNQAVKKVRSLHSYEVPAIIIIDFKSGDTRYSQWINKELK